MFLFCLFALDCVVIVAVRSVQNHKYLNSEMRAHKAGLTQPIIEYTREKQLKFQQNRERKKTKANTVRLSVLNFSVVADNVHAHISHQQTHSYTHSRIDGWNRYASCGCSLSHECHHYRVMRHIFISLSYIWESHMRAYHTFSTLGRICTHHTSHNTKFIRISFFGIFIWSLTGTRIRERHTATENVYRAHHVRCSKCDDVDKQIMTEWVNINKLNRVHACTDHRCIANTRCRRICCSYCP